MADKDFRPIEEQLDILISRGLAIDDREKAAKFLYYNNYYRVSGYSLTLRKNDVFFKTANFQNIVDIYKFDSELRHILLKYIEIIEVSVKSVYAYEFTKVYGATGHLNPDNFTNKDKHKEIIDKADQQKKARHKHEAYLKHFIDDLHQDIPLWAYVDLLTISDISFLYSISFDPVKNAVAQAFNLKSNGDELLGRFMHSMTIIRNLCAHGSRIYNRLFEQRPWLSKKEKSLLRKKTDGTLDNDHLYSFIFIMKRLLDADVFAEMKAEIKELTEKYPFVRMSYYGFRDDWAKML